jgi:hypothetical protein
LRGHLDDEGFEPAPSPLRREGKMKKLLAALAVTALFVLPVAGVATAGTGPTMAQFRQLQRQVNRVATQVDQLQDRLSELEAAPPLECLGSLGVAEYDGYVYDLYDPFETTALSLPDPGDMPDWQVVIRTC